MRVRTWVIIVLSVVAVFSFVTYGERGTIQAALNHFKLIPMPERFTELYFENPASLPTQTVAGKPMSFAFGIRNAEGATTTYPYEARLEEPVGYTINLQTGTVTLAPDASTTIFVSYPFSVSNITGKIVVDLTSLDQHIDFLLRNPN